MMRYSSAFLFLGLKSYMPEGNPKRRQGKSMIFGYIAARHMVRS